ncbi:MAG: HslU--HslV peptidase proteolytic subunit [Candidatus Schekmanbacteria bacterium RBG_13_48_7]|uniref:ATP-dependent protease subunit HslV n=1 Tax=Candidatus Schekmanbacteria bacterium RBG_13_48_7 TaxID=1817878 RepID=A0A1F7RPI8_9BACT|nr:MAG: HslU--HslV peptidase proteolytic subunit [Candidatus Schekmanbacteria bacterium RBG_13_48_7]
MISTTILCVRFKNEVAIAGDGQVTFNQTIMKNKATKIRRMYNDQIIAGFAGASADALALFEKFEQKLDEYRGNFGRAAVELAKDWRIDRAMRRLEALLLVANYQQILLISGTGDVIEPDDGMAAIGSGGPFALAASRGLVKVPDITAEQIVREAMNIASDLCIYTNKNITVEVLSAQKGFTHG